MNDRERILLTILDRMYYTQVVALRGYEEKRLADTVHFGGYDDRPIAKGDLVMGQTTGIHDWKIGWVVEVTSFDECIIREIGTERTCRLSNERFTRIVGLHPSLTLEGDKFIFQQKVKKAFARGDEYMYRFGGVEFGDNKTARIFIREAFGGFDSKNPSVPFSFNMKWNAKTSVKAILDEMKLAGYGTRKFEHNTTEEANND